MDWRRSASSSSRGSDDGDQALRRLSFRMRKCSVDSGYLESWSRASTSSSDDAIPTTIEELQEAQREGGVRWKWAVIKNEEDYGSQVSKTPNNDVFCR